MPIVTNEDRLERRNDGPRLSCFVSEDWRDGARLWQAVCLLEERLMQRLGETKE